MKITIAKIDFEVEFDKIDDSFDHEFGTQHQHHYECSSIKIGDVEVIEILNSDFILKIEEKIYEIEN